MVNNEQKASSCDWVAGIMVIQSNLQVEGIELTKDWTIWNRHSEKSLFVEQTSF